MEIFRALCGKYYPPIDISGDVADNNGKVAYQCLSDKPLLTLFSSSFRPAILIKVNAGRVALSLENYFFGLICRVIFRVHIAHEAYICVPTRFLSKLNALIF